MEKLSVVIITYNEEANIGSCISSVRQIADEILVLDSFSSDDTRNICQNMGVRFEQHIFDGHIQQKNRAKNMASNNWVLSLDADEKPDEQLLHSIKAMKEANFNNADGFTMNRLNFYCGKPVKTCGWYPDKKLRLWKKNKGEWTGVNPHDRFELNAGCITQHLSGDILHNTYPTHEAMLRQVDKFAQIAAAQLKKKPTHHLLMKMLFSSTFKFVRNYIFKLGFTDGISGFRICFHQMREVYLKYYWALLLKYDLKQ